MFAAGRQSEQTKEEAATANGEQRQRRRDRTDARNHAQSGRLIPQRSLFLHRLPPLQNATNNSHKRAEGRVASGRLARLIHAEDLEPIFSANLSHQRHESLDRISS